jgi:hypothetical protein
VEEERAEERNGGEPFPRGFVWLWFKKRAKSSELRHRSCKEALLW